MWVVELSNEVFICCHAGAEKIRDRASRYQCLYLQSAVQSNSNVKLAMRSVRSLVFFSESSEFWDSISTRNGSDMTALKKADSTIYERCSVRPVCGRF